MQTGPKPPNLRRDDLLDRAVDHLLAHGMEGLSFRKLGDAVGVAPNALTYHFGHRQDLIAAIFTRLAERMRVPPAGDPDPDGVPGRMGALWARLTDPRYTRVWPAFFECYAVALRHPEQHRAFLDHVMHDWVVPLSNEPAAATMSPEQARGRATLLVAAVRGLAIDHLAGADPDRIAAALRELGMP
jgi:AcrR family transcriptional regulator